MANNTKHNITLELTTTQRALLAAQASASMKSDEAEAEKKTTLHAAAQMFVSLGWIEEGYYISPDSVKYKGKSLLNAVQYQGLKEAYWGGYSDNDQRLLRLSSDEAKATLGDEQMHRRRYLIAYTAGLINKARKAVMAINKPPVEGSRNKKKPTDEFAIAQLLTVKARIKNNADYEFDAVEAIKLIDKALAFIKANVGKAQAIVEAKANAK